MKKLIETVAQHEKKTTTFVCTILSCKHFLFLIELIALTALLLNLVFIEFFAIIALRLKKMLPSYLLAVMSATLFKICAYSFKVVVLLNEYTKRTAFF